MHEWMSEWVSELLAIHGFWMAGSVGISGLQTGRAGFVIHLEKGWPGVWTDAWVSDCLVNTASVANTWVNAPYTKGKI